MNRKYYLKSNGTITTRVTISNCTFKKKTYKSLDIGSSGESTKPGKKRFSEKPVRSTTVCNISPNFRADEKIKIKLREAIREVKVN